MWAAFSARSCSFLGTPPKTMATQTPIAAPTSVRTSPICSASSRVGATTAMHGVYSTWVVLEHIVTPGPPKARVFPDPVEAIPMRSRFCRMIGQHCDWMGEGRSNDFNRKACSLAGKPACLNSVTGRMSFDPPTSTVMSSLPRRTSTSCLDSPDTSACSKYSNWPPRVLFFFDFEMISKGLLSLASTVFFFFFFFLSELASSSSLFVSSVCFCAASSSFLFFFFSFFFKALSSCKTSISQFSSFSTVFDFFDFFLVNSSELGMLLNTGKTIV
mmetsp:Transcript_15410/g.21252  ORF Transcript_15410/g.21252 Transcript_15410/m.21252 type:complete len:272 (-) Transcript_15410:117-932(-)